MLHIFRNRRGFKEASCITPQEIRATLLLKGISQAAIAKKLKVSQPLVSMVIHGTDKNKRVRKEIARIIGKTSAEIWPM